MAPNHWFSNVITMAPLATIRMVDGTAYLTHSMKEMGSIAACAYSATITPATELKMVTLPQSVTHHASSSHAKVVSGPDSSLRCGATSNTQGMDVNTRHSRKQSTVKPNTDRAREVPGCSRG